MRIHHAIYRSEHFGTFELERENGAPDFLFLFFRTPTMLNISGKTYTLRTPSAVVFSDYTKHKYISLTQEYCDDFIHFEAGEEERILRELHFPLNMPVQISNEMSISKIVQGICDERKRGSEFTLQIQHHLMMLLIWRLAEEWQIQSRQHPEVPYFDKLQKIRQGIQDRPEKIWRVPEMAKEASLSSAYFQVLYKKAFGVTCMTDVIRVKTERAKEYLVSTDMAVSAIAEELGYTQVCHFIRQFKKQTGLTPGAFRKSMRT